MKLLKMVGIFFVFLVILGVIAATSIKGDVESMQNENPAIFVINPENREIELGVALNREEGSAVLLDPAQKVGNVYLRDLFKNSEKSGADAITGSEIKGYTYADEKIMEKVAAVDRVVLIDDTVVAEIFALVAPKKIEIGEKGELFYAQHTVDAAELLRILRGEIGGMEWEVTITNPLLDKPLVRKITTDELLNTANQMGIQMNENLIKVLILAQIGDQVSQELQSNEIKAEIFSITLRGYKEGKIRTYPENTLTKAIKYIPERQLMNLMERMG
ncbi:hypothetical protein [Candidatus Pyrohabitans sp.]